MITKQKLYKLILPIIRMATTLETMAIEKDFEGMDIGELYQEIHNAVLDEELDAIKTAGINLGHIGVINTVYHTQNLRRLQSAGATPEELLDYDRDFIEGVYNPTEVRETRSGPAFFEPLILNNGNRVDLEYATERELAYCYALSVQNRGFSTRTDTSTGECFNRLLTERETIKDRAVFTIYTEAGPTKVKYHELNETFQKQADLWLVDAIIGLYGITRETNDHKLDFE